MNVAKRTKKLKALLDLRLGPGAALLPRQVKRIHLDFAFLSDDGHFGPRKFWRLYLPSLKYHNPAISMTVNRTSNQEGPATLSIFFAPSPQSNPPTASSAPSGAITDPANLPASELSDDVKSIDVKHLHSSEILDKFLVATEGQLYEATAEEKAEQQEVKEFKERSEADRMAQERLNQVRAQEEAILEQSRRSVS